MKMNSLQDHVTKREILQVGSGHFLTAVGGLVGIRVLTRLMSPAVYGELALGMTFFFLVQQLLTGPVNNGIARYYPLAVERSGLREYMNAVYHLLLGSGLITFLLFVITSLFLFFTGHSSWISLVFLTFLFTVFSGFNLSMDSIQNGARHRRVVAWHQALSQWLRFLMAAGCIAVLGVSSSAAMAGFLISAILVAASQYYFMKSRIFSAIKSSCQSNTDRPVNWWRGKIIRFSLPFILWGIFTWLLISSDRWALMTFHTTHSVGLYTVLYQLGYYPVTVLSGIAVQLISPMLYSIAGDGKSPQRTLRARSATHRMVLISMVFTFAAVLASWILSERIFSVLVAPQYRYVHSLLPLVVLSAGIFASGQICTLTALNNHQPHILIAPKISTGILGTGLNIAGAALFGVKGVVLGGVIFSLVYFIWVLLLMRPGRLTEKMEKRK